MDFLDLISEILPYVLSILATIVAFYKKPKSKLTSEEIEAKAEAKKQKLIAKLNKKNHISGVTFQTEVTEASETNKEDNSSGYTCL